MLTVKHIRRDDTGLNWVSMKPINQKSRRHYFNAITNHLLESCTVQHTEMLSRLHRFFRSSIFVRDVRWRLVRGIICPCHIVLCLCSCCRTQSGWWITVAVQLITPPVSNCYIDWDMIYPWLILLWFLWFYLNLWFSRLKISTFCWPPILHCEDATEMALDRPLWSLLAASALNWCKLNNDDYDDDDYLFSHITPTSRHLSW